MVCIQAHCFVVPVVAGDEDPLRQGRFQTHVFQQSVTLTAKMWPDVSKEHLWLVLLFVCKTSVSASCLACVYRDDQELRSDGSQFKIRHEYTTVVMLLVMTVRILPVVSIRGGPYTRNVGKGGV